MKPGLWTYIRTACTHRIFYHFIYPALLLHKPDSKNQSRETNQKCSNKCADRFDRNSKPFQRFCTSRLFQGFRRCTTTRQQRKNSCIETRTPVNTITPISETYLMAACTDLSLETEIEMDGRKLGIKYFADDRDTALSFPSDGFCLFDSGSGTCWPLVLFNFNLPPEERVHTRQILSVGLIPGPKKPEDFDSFHLPISGGAFATHNWSAYTGCRPGKFFYTQGASPLCFRGYTPAVSMIMHMKGAGSFHPCRMCNAASVRHSHN